MGKSTRYPVVSRSNPEAAGVCDRGGEVVRHSQLRKEMVWRGKSLAWNGFMCCERHLDEPQPQDRTFILRADPVPIKNPRPYLPAVLIDSLVSDDVADGTVAGGPVTDENGIPLRSVPDNIYPD